MSVYDSWATIGTALLLAVLLSFVLARALWRRS
jgi:hypothetical protein